MTYPQQTKLKQTNKQNAAYGADAITLENQWHLTDVKSSVMVLRHLNLF